MSQGENFTRGSPRGPLGTLSALNAKPTPSTTLQPALCVAPRAAGRANFGKQEAPAESRPGAMHYEETTNLSCSATIGKIKGYQQLALYIVGSREDIKA